MWLKLVALSVGALAQYAAGAVPPTVTLSDPQSVTASVDLTRPLHRMAGGIGASWHAIRVEFQPASNVHYQFRVREQCPQGSAVGANPPLDSAAWKDIARLGRWLGLDWLRVEIDRRMYEPRKGQFTWDSEEMQTLYRILDWCQSNGADVFLTEMWRDIDWLAFPGVHPLMSAPNSLDDFAAGLATLADHLLREKRYTCVKWLCLANEPPGGTWGYWWSRGPEDAPLSPAFKAVRQALDQRGIDLPLSGPDWTDLPHLEVTKLDFASCLGAYDVHSYGAPDDGISRTLQDWAQWGHQQGKPFFLSELGDMSLGWGNTNPGPRSFEAVLSVAEKILRGLNVGVDGFNRWSFLNRGDRDGQWQLVRTWDMERKRYLARAEPETVPFYGYAMLTRFTAKHSEVLPCTLQFANSPNQSPHMFAAALRSPRGHLTLLLVNREGAPIKTRFEWNGLARKTTFYGYALTEERLTRPGFELAADSRQVVSPGEIGFTHAIPARSVVVFTTYDLKSDAPGVTSEDRR